jgi:hypothetical protein
MSFILKKNSTTITLPSPELGNTYELSLNSIVRRTRGNVLKVFSDYDWKGEVRRTFIFKNVKIDTVNSFITFITENAGLQIEYIDHFGLFSLGFITTTVFDMDTEKDLCSYTIGFEILDLRTNKNVNLDAVLTKANDSVVYMDAILI